MSSIITHESLYEILLKEKTRNELQVIEESFFTQLQSYIEEKKLILSSQKEKASFPEEVKKTEKQLQSIQRLSNEIIERRKRKILDLALLNSRTPSAIPLKGLLPREQGLYNSTLKALNQYDFPLETKTKTLKNENPLSISVKFLDSIPKFIGTDNKVYGPFEKTDIATLPKTIAQILINRKKAENEDSKNSKEVLS
jgi:DNA replication initiation complex subunit (GINS family)|tara:strand:+ start:14271 stop:14861 length:591 start_codon:yes stop_codon:yes gene_type:complete